MSEFKDSQNIVSFRTETNSKAILIVLAILIPPIGFVIGLVRLFGNESRRKLGSYMLILSMVSGAFIFAIALYTVSPVSSVRRSVMAEFPATYWWWEGNLHEATLQDWREASYENKLYTSADIIVTVLWEEPPVKRRDQRKLLKQASSVVEVLDDSPTSNSDSTVSVADLIAMTALMTEVFSSMPLTM